MENIAIINDTSFIFLFVRNNILDSQIPDMIESYLTSEESVKMAEFAFFLAIISCLNLDVSNCSVRLTFTSAIL